MDTTNQPNQQKRDSIKLPSRRLYLPIPLCNRDIQVLTKSVVASLPCRYYLCWFNQLRAVLNVPIYERENPVAYSASVSWA